MIKDLITVVVPTYNDAHYLKDCLDDLLKQTYNNFEAIIVNDGSTDNTEEIIQEYRKKDSRFILINKENGGTGTALNLGFKNAKGEFGTWVSSDDRKEIDFLETLVNFLKQNRDIEFVTSAFYSEHVGKNLRAFIPDELSLKGYRRGFFGVEHGECSGQSFKVDEWIDINLEQCYQGVNFMFTMNLKNKCGDYIEIPGEDYHMTAKMGLNSRVGYIDKVLGTHKDPIDSLSNMNRACVAQANFLTRKLILDNHVSWKLKNIPKVAHFYWGSKKMSYLRFMTLKTFKALNPDWSVILYVPKTSCDNITWYDKSHRSDSADYMSEEDYFARVKELPIKIKYVNFPEKINNLGEAQKSDYLRWRILYDNGGVWSDMDIIYVKPMNQIYLNENSYSNTDGTVSFHKEHSHQIGFFLTSPKNSLFKELTILTSLKETPKFYQDFGCYLLNSIGEPKIINDKFSLDLINLDGDVIYFFDHKNLDKIFEKNYSKELTSKTIGIHWYGGAEISQKYNNLLKENNLTDYNSTITQAILNLELL